MNLRPREPRDSSGEGQSQGSEVVASLEAISARQANLEPKAHILVVEDNPFVREGLVKLLNRQNDLLCCGEADSIASAPNVMAEQKPSLVLLDLRLKDGEAFELIGILRRQSPMVPILVLSQSDEGLYAEKVLRVGAQGYIMKQEAAGELLHAIRTVLLGRIYASPAMARRLPRELYPS